MRFDAARELIALCRLCLTTTGRGSKIVRAEAEEVLRRLDGVAGLSPVAVDCVSDDVRKEVT